MKKVLVLLILFTIFLKQINAQSAPSSSNNYLGNFIILFLLGLIIFTIWKGKKKLLLIIIMFIFLVFVILGIILGSYVGFEELLFLLLLISIYGIWEGRKKPLIASFIFIGIGVFALLKYFLSLAEISNQQHNEDRQHNESGFMKLIILILISFAIGGYYLYKAYLNKNNTNLNNNIQSDLYTQIKNLSELKEKGIITEAEFEEKKQKLLSKIN